MSIVKVDLEDDAVAKLEAAKAMPSETLSEVVRRASFPRKPLLARDLAALLGKRVGWSPLSDEALDLLSERQSEAASSPSHWGES